MSCVRQVRITELGGQFGWLRDADRGHDFGVITPRESNREIDRRLNESRQLGERMERSGGRAVTALCTAADALRNGRGRPVGRRS